MSIPVTKGKWNHLSYFSFLSGLKKRQNARPFVAPATFHVSYKFINIESSETDIAFRAPPLELLLQGHQAPLSSNLQLPAPPYQLPLGSNQLTVQMIQHRLLQPVLREPSLPTPELCVKRLKKVEPGRRLRQPLRNRKLALLRGLLLYTPSPLDPVCLLVLLVLLTQSL